MPIVTYQSPFATFRGLVRGASGSGGQVTYPVGEANYSRAFAIPANPESDHQVLMRAYLGQASQGYSALSEIQANAWRVAAADESRKNAAGQEYDLSGANLYALINAYRLMDGQALTATPPALTAPGAVTSIGVVDSDTSDLNMVIVHTCTAAVDFFFVRVTTPLTGGARNARTNEYRTVTNAYASSIIPVEATPMDLTLALEQFVITADDYIGVEVLPIGPTYYPGIARREANLQVIVTP